MAGTGFHSIAKLCAQILNPAMADRGVMSADCHNKNGSTADCQSRSLHLRADCHRFEPSAGFILGLSGGWQSAVLLRADCQAVILIVANRGIGARSLAIN
jgi:hypothetical protein